MINLKLTVISSVLGLVFSLLIGLVSQVTFGYMILRAVISAVLTGGIAAAASFVFKKFLADDAVSMTVAQSTTSSTGNMVDITLKVDEDVLPDADNAPQFYVSPEALRVKKPVDVYRMASKKSTPAAEESMPEPTPAAGTKTDGAFVPKPLVSEATPQYSVVPDMASLAEVPMPGDTDSTIEKDSAGSAGLEGLDELPDLSNVVADTADDSGVISDSDFATADNPPASYSAQGGKQNVEVGNDASLMADTIRTLLNSEG